jgi:ASCH domain
MNQHKEWLVSKALIVRSPWIERILDRTKTWELRGRRTTLRGRVGLIRSRSKCVVGTCEIVDVLGPLSVADLRGSREKHCVPLDQLRELHYRKTYAWVLRNARRLRHPVPYQHPSGAVIWVNLTPRERRRVISEAHAPRRS